MKSRKNYAISILFLIALVIITFMWFFQEYDFKETISAIRQAAVIFLVAAVMLNLMFVFCEAWNLHALLKSLDCEVPFRKCIKYVFVECYFCAITPSASGGQPAQLVYMHDDGIPFSKSTVSLLIIAITYKMSLLVYAVILYLFSKESFISSMGRLKYLFYLGIAMNVAAVAFMVLALFSAGILKRGGMAFIHFAGRHKLLKHQEKWEAKFEYTMDEYQKGSVYISKHRGLCARIMAVTMIQRTCRFAVTYLVYLAFSLSGYSLFSILMLQSIVSISADMLPIPGAVGVSESCYMRIFKKAFTGSYVLPSMVLSRGVSFYGMVLLSSFVVIVAQIRKMQRNILETKGKGE